MYGLETIQLTQNEMNKLDSFQMKCTRRILKSPPTSIDRTQTNQIVTDRAKNYNLGVTEIFVVWKNRNSSCLGIRRDHADPLRQVLFGYRTFAPRILPTKRGGRPKLDWFYTPSVECRRRTPTKLTQITWRRLLFSEEVLFSHQECRPDSAISLRVYCVNTKNTTP